MVRICDFKVERPPFCIAQVDVLKWLAAAHGLHGADEEAVYATFVKLGLGEKKVQKRYTFYQDCEHRNWDEMEIHGKDMGARMRYFDEKISGYVKRLYIDSEIPEDVIQVSCTGYVAPSPVQRILAEKSPYTVVTNAYHMGCYAAVPALRMGSGFLACGKERVDVIHTELCTLHMGTHEHEISQLVAETLFGDGLIKYSLSPESGPGFEIVSLREELIPNTVDFMRWQMENWGMRMFLALEIPLAIRRGIKGFVSRLYPGDIKKAVFALHPGGPRIIDQIARALDLSEEQIMHSRKVFESCGNMSSATVPHIWAEMEKDLEPGTDVISLAFGPGLTIVGAHLRCC